jgi:hypothetical protein
MSESGLKRANTVFFLDTVPPLLFSEGFFDRLRVSEVEEAGVIHYVSPNAYFFLTYENAQAFMTLFGRWPCQERPPEGKGRETDLYQALNCIDSSLVLCDSGTELVIPVCEERVRFVIKKYSNGRGYIDGDDTSVPVSQIKDRHVEILVV